MLCAQAPEMMVLMMRAPGFKHTGYTKAVDWWSLGVSLYRLLTGEYPFDTEIPTPSTPAAMLTEGSDRYTVLLEKVDYAPLVLYPDAVDFVSKLLTVDDTKRMGYGPSGSIAVSSHPFYRSINWVDLEKKMSQPPPLPTSCAPHRAWRDPTTLENVLQLYKRNEWLDPPNRVSMTNLQRLREDALNAELEFWDYTSPSAVLAELGENTMEDT
jgi:serine/threonine protein kinase